MLDSEGVIDREKLGKVIFSDPAKRRKLDKVPVLMRVASTALLASFEATHGPILTTIVKRTLWLMLQGGKCCVPWRSRKASLVRHREVTAPSSWTCRCCSSSRSCAAFASLPSSWCWCCLGPKIDRIFSVVLGSPAQGFRIECARSLPPWLAAGIGAEVLCKAPRSPETQLTRLMARNDLSEDEAARF